MDVLKLHVDALKKGKHTLAKYTGMLLMVLAGHTAQAQQPHTPHHTTTTPTEQTDSTHVAHIQEDDSTHTVHAADDTHHDGEGNTQGIHPYGAVQVNYNHQQGPHMGGQFIMGAYGKHTFNPHTSLDYNVGFWPLGYDENLYDHQELNRKKIIYNANVTLRNTKVGNFQVGKVGTIPQFVVKTFRPVAEEDRFIDEVDVLHVAEGFSGISYSHDKVPGLQIWGGDVSHKDDSTHRAGGVSYAKDLGNAKISTIGYAGNHNVTGIVNRGENYGHGTKNRYATDLLFTFQTPYKPHHEEEKTEEHVDSTGNVSHHVVREKVHHTYTVSGHILGSYYRDISPRMFMIIKMGGEVISTIEGEHVEVDANGRISCFFTLHPTGDHNFAISWGGYGQVNQHGHIEAGGGLTFTIGHGNRHY